MHALFFASVRITQSPYISNLPASHSCCSCTATLPNLGHATVTSIWVAHHSLLLQL